MLGFTISLALTEYVRSAGIFEHITEYVLALWVAHGQFFINDLHRILYIAKLWKNFLYIALWLFIIVHKSHRNCTYSKFINQITNPKWTYISGVCIYIYIYIYFYIIYVWKCLINCGRPPWQWDQSAIRNPARANLSKNVVRLSNQSGVRESPWGAGLTLDPP